MPPTAITPDEEQRYAALHAAFERGLHASCVELATSFVADYPDNGTGWAILGVACTRLQRYPEARRALQRALRRVDPDNVSLPLIWMGDLYQRKGDLKQAVVWYRRALHAAPDHLRPRLALADALHQLGDQPEAEALLRELLTISIPDPFEIHLLLAQVLTSQGSFEEALSQARAAQALEPGSPRALLLLDDLAQVFQHRRTSIFRLVQ